MLGVQLPAIVVLLIALLIIWIIASIPAYIAGKIVTHGKASFGSAMVATLGGVIMFVIVAVAVDYFLGTLLGASSLMWGLLLGFVAFLAVYKSAFDTGWLGALAIAILSVIVAAVLSLILAALFGVSFPPSLSHAVSI
jgi:hypothetical protein